MVNAWLKSAARLTLVVMFLTLALPNRASADDTAHDIYREKLAIPEGLYTFEKGDADCEGTTAELHYASVEKDISLILGAKYIFSNFDRPSFSENVNNGSKERCTVTTTTSISAQLIESKVAQTCKDKSQNYQQTQKLKLTSKQLSYEFERTQAWDKKPVKLHCEYQVSAAGGR